MSETGMFQARSLQDTRAVVDRLRTRREEIAQAIYDRIRDAVPDSERSLDPVYQAGVVAAINGVLGYCFDAIEYGPGWSAPIPREAAAQARRAARAGVSSGAVLRRYVAANGRLGDFVADETECLGLASHAPALLHIRRTQDALLGYFTAAIEHEHERERKRIARSPEQRRLDLVCRLLEEGALGVGELAQLTYRFDAWHVGVVAVGGNARAALESLKGECQLLAVSHSEETAWGWLGAQRKQADPAGMYLQCASPRVSVAVGEPARGLTGWRETHRQAQDALQVALLEPQELTRYADVALLVPWVKDPRRAQTLVDLHLSPLDDQRDNGSSSRRMLRAYFEAGRNVSKAAAKLGVERRTLAYRLRTIEARLGCQLEDHLAELELALRLHDLLASRN